MGLFLPPMADPQVHWTRAPDEATPGKPAWTSYQTLNDYSRWMRTHGFHVLNYFNVTEYGRNMQFPPPPRQAENDADLWKDPHCVESDTATVNLFEVGKRNPGCPVLCRGVLQNSRGKQCPESP